MKALLVQSPATSPWVPRRQWEPPSIALATIAAHVDQHDVKVADTCVWRKKAVSRYLKLLEELRPQVVGFSAMTFQYDAALRFASLTRNMYPNVKTVLGGYHATLRYEEIAESADANYWDFLLRGEGDFSFGELLDCLEGGGTGLEKVRGLSFRQDVRYVHNPKRPLEDITKIKLPARHKRVAEGFHMYFRRTDVIETSRGCLYQCYFCSIREMYGTSYRLFPMERVLADIEDAYRRGARHIFCTDDNITLDMDRFEQLMDGVISLKLKNLRFTTQASPIGFAKCPGIAKKMVEAGFVSIFLGIENASTKSLRKMKKPNTIELIHKGVRELQSQDICVIAGLINGLPHDDPDSMRENYRFIKDLGIHSVMDQIMTPYPKTPLRNEMLNERRVANAEDFRWYDGYFANVHTDTMSAEELNFSRWKIRREVIGMWRPTKADWKYFQGYTYVWELGLRHIVWLNERLLELLFGLEGRYRLQMRHFLQLNNFGIEMENHSNGGTYHPVFGTREDPFKDTRLSLLRRKRQFTADSERPTVITGP